MKNFKKSTVLISLLLVFALILAGCGSGSDSKQGASKSTFNKVKEQGYVSIGFANEAPFAYATPDGKLTGLNVEIARTVFKKLGINEVQGVLTEFGSLIPGLNAGRFDVITAGMYITPDRSKQVDFANPEYTIGGGLAVKAGNPYNLHSYKDIAANPKVKIAVMSGAAEYDHLKAVGVSDDQIVSVPDQPSALAALQANRADAITMTSAALTSLFEKVNDPKIERVEDFKISVVDGKSQQAFGSAAFRQVDDDFRDAYNSELAKLKESGELLEIYKSFGFTKDEFPGNVTAEEAIKMW
ncbi:MAG: ectoine/hydroxyectoine ABC transporter substrate-binding protein EhuB [Bacillota bacterium]